MGAFTLKVDPNGIATLVFDLPGEKINKFSTPVMKEFEGIIDDLKTHNDIRALIITSAKPDIFIAGADVKEIQRADASAAGDLIKGGHRTFNKLSHLPFPTIAMINGVCLGGGMELALACTYRVVTDNPKTMLGLPEVTLGIMPGWGGTQRMPRLIGLTEGLGMVLSGKPVNGTKAYKLKLADAIVPAEFSDAKLNEFVTTILTSKGKKQVLERRKRGGLSYWLLEGNPLGREFVFWKARKDLLEKTKGHYPAPLIALEAIKKGFPLPLEKGLDVEIDAFVKNMESGFGNSKNLTQIFFTSESLKKDAGVPVDAKPLKVNSAGVIGAGTMGAGLTWFFSNQGIPVRMKDINWDVVAKGYASINDIYKKLVKIRKLNHNEANLRFHHVSGTTDYSGFKNLDLIIEAATENIDLKHKIFAEIEENTKPNAIIATNTSSLSVNEMASKFKHPERFLGMHFFNPVNRMPLVEIIPGQKTSPEALATAIDICRKFGKTPIVVGDCAGFLVNRVFMQAANEAMRLFEDGVEMNRLSKLMLDFGMPMDPFELGDEVGNDVTYHVSNTLEKAYGNRAKGAEINKKMFDAKLFGKKVGKGFYIWKGKEKKVNPEIFKFVKNESAKNLSDQEIMDRINFLMINEAARCIEEKVISRPDYLDMAMIMGTGYPPFRGGVLKYADSRGINTVVDSLNRFAEKYGERFKPCNLLVTMAKNNQKFYDQPSPSAAGLEVKGSSPQKAAV